MIIIPKKPRESRTIAYVKKLPLFLQIPIVMILLAMAWQFRFYQTGVDASTLTKTQGILYEASCQKSISGSDTIRLRTSLQNEIITFSGWQKCSNINWQSFTRTKNPSATFYTRNHRYITSNDSFGDLYVFAVDLQSPYEQKFIYPARGLILENNPNPFGMFLLFMAILIAHSILSDYFENKEKSKK